MTYDSEVAADSPWGYWKTNEASGSTLADSSGNARDMAITGSPTLAQTGPSGAADAVAWPASTVTYAKVANSSPLSGASGFTIEAWVYLTANPGGIAAVVGEGANATGTSNTEFGLSIDTSGRPVFYMFNTAVRNLTGSALSLNTWHHIVAVGSVTGGMSLRVDKVADGTLAENSLASTYSRAMWIHASGRSNAGGPVTISHAAFYSAPLTTTRIDAHYDAMVSSPNATVNAVAATATAAAMAPAVSAGSSVTGVAATATAAAVVPGVSAAFSAAPPAATATAASVAPTVSADSSVTAPAATATAEALPPSTGATSDASVNAVPATATADAVAPSVSGSSDATVNAVAATATATVLPPTLAWSSSIAAAAATATAAALVPSVSLGATVAAVRATATGAAVAPTVFNGSPDATVEAVAATATADALAPAVVGTSVVGTDVSNGLGGRRRSAFAHVVVTSPAGAAPTNVATKVDKAVAYPTPVMVNGRPT